MSRYSNYATQLMLLVFLVHSTCALCSNLRVGHPKIRCIDAERQALLKFISSWGGEESKRDCCEWMGVGCANGSVGHVLMLNLSSVLDNHGRTIHPWGVLSGTTTSSSLVELQYLNHLDLSGIDISGYPMPTFIGTLTKLKYLNLSSTGISGEIPPQLANLTKLEFLDLSSNSDLILKNLEWLSHIPSLRELDLSYTNMSQANDWVQVVNKLPYLNSLQMRECGLPDIVPSPLFLTNSSTSLHTLDLSENYLSVSLYKWLFGFSSSLVHLDLGSNHLEGHVPEAFGNMSGLSFLNLDANMLNGEIPESIWNLCSLETVSAKENKLSGQLPDLSRPLFWCANYSLQHLNLASNRFMGSLSSHTLVPSLKELRLSSNLLNGTVPAEIGKLSELEVLDISKNYLHGVIFDSHFSSLSKLSHLGLAYNSFVLNMSLDWIPPFQLEIIHLGSCKLGPQLPNWLQTQKKYYYLDVSNTGISHSIPNWFWNKFPTETDYLLLNFSSNQLSGIVNNYSSFNASKYFFVGIDLSSNELEGSIPTFFFKMNELHLSRNKFSQLNSLCDIDGYTSLDALDLSHNQLFGEIPDCWRNFASLRVLSLANNKLSGKIPISVGSLNEMRTLHLENNTLDGRLPPSLNSCKQLKFLSVGDNKLSGPIPAWIGEDLQDLATLSLRNNHFRGSMPSSLCLLTNLQVLDLSRNKISGSIPKCLTNLSAMKPQHILDEETDTTYMYFSVSAFIAAIYDQESFSDDLIIEWKGKLSMYKKTLRFVKSIDLSSNKLMGEIPGTITELVELVSLNLSRNNLSGQIPLEIGQLKSLDALDLSNNHLVGRIPTSLSKVDRLSTLDLSNNNLSGEIPRGTQLQSFNDTAYMGNSKLCGDPLPKCPRKSTGSRPIDKARDQEDHDNKLITRGFYVNLGVGFVIGFWGVCGSLIFNKSWRYLYFKLLNDINDLVYVTAMMTKAKLLRIIEA
ncbi:LRR domain containing protein [Parasponia andersonii]|uniref:LRR domain containing protein n=1 Tax=Parasponia andersonii TaxID=3476 RepID=A0A2P5BUG9_PARAD|nr:LRR domain containing protein [Parasponia andersonii]